MDPALLELLKSREYADEEEIEAIVRLDSPLARVPGIRFVSEFGLIATCRLRKDAIAQVREEENVLSLKQSRVLTPEVEPYDEGEEYSLPLTAVNSDIRRPPGLGPTGAGIIIGIVDWVCGFDHWNFRFADGSTRLLALWDQRGTGAHNRYGYGTIYTQDQINRALQSSDPYFALGYRSAPRGHGTVVMDIAAGNGLGGGPSGVARDARLIFVNLANKGTRGLANLGSSVRILEAIDFIRRIAGSRPWVINCSVGNHGGPHDGKTLIEMALDYLLSAAPNRFICQSTGNYFSKSIHASGCLRTGEERTLSMIVDEADYTPNELEVWYSGKDEFAIRFESPTGTLSQWVGLGKDADLLENGRIVGRLYNRACDPNNKDNHIDCFLYPAAPPGMWRATIRAIRAINGSFHAWLERDDACPECQTRFSESDADPLYTIGTIANSHLPMVVGAYNAHSPTRDIAPFSSSSPTRDGRCKPDAVAPGYRVLAARSSSQGWYTDPERLVRLSGSSMASPYAAGVAALCLQAAGRPLWAHEIRALILDNTDPPPSDPQSVLRYGRGYINITKAVAAASRLSSLVTSPLVSHPVNLGIPNSTEEEMEPYSDRHYFELLDQVIEKPASRAASEKNLLAQILRVNELPFEPGDIDLDKLYRQLVSGSTVGKTQSIARHFTILARPGEALISPPQKGDILLRVALGHPGLGHVAVITEPTLRQDEQLSRAPFGAERRQPGYYALVSEAGACPHPRSQPFARRILDKLKKMLPSQLLIRLKRSEFDREPGLRELYEEYESPASASQADDKFVLKEAKLSTQKIVIAAAGNKEKGAAVALLEAPAVFLPEIIGMARDMALKNKKNDLAARLDPATWFKKFTRTTFLGRELERDDYLYLDMAKRLKEIEQELSRTFSMDPKRVGDLLLNKSTEAISGSRLVSSTAKFSMHMFGLAVDVNRRGNPYIESQNDIKGLNNVLRNAALLTNSPISKYEEGGDAKSKFERIRQLDSVVEDYFSLLDKPTELAQLLQASTSPEWRGLSLEAARDKIQKNLKNLAGLLARGNQVDYFKTHGILNFNKRFVEAMENRGLSWGGHYGDMMHFDMRGAGVGFYVNKARVEYSRRAKKLAKQLFNEKRYGQHSLKDIRTQYDWELEAGIYDSSLDWAEQDLDTLASELEDAYHSRENLPEEAELLADLEEGENQFTDILAEDSGQVETVNEEDWEHAVQEDEDDVRGQYDSFVEQTAEQESDFTEELVRFDDFLSENESEQFLGEETASLLICTSKSNPPGETLCVQISLGNNKYEHCIQWEKLTKEQRKQGMKPNCLKTGWFGIPAMTGIFIPDNYVTQAKVDLILYLHGHKSWIPGLNTSIDQYWDGEKQYWKGQSYPILALREEINNSKKNVILVAPSLGNKSEPGDLVKRPNGLDEYLEKVLDALKAYGPYQGQQPTVGNLILAAHSGGGTYMRKLALSSNRYAANIKECWGFDCMYSGDYDLEGWLKWAKQNLGTGAKLYSYYWKGSPAITSKRLQARVDKNEKLSKAIITKPYPGKEDHGHFLLIIPSFRESLQNSQILGTTTKSAQVGDDYFLPDLEQDFSFEEESYEEEDAWDSEDRTDACDCEEREAEGIDSEEEEYQDALEDWESEESKTTSALRESIVRAAKQEWERWEQGTKAETDSTMHGALRGYWMNLGYRQSEADKKISDRSAWSAAFISYVMRQAGAGQAFAYSGAHTRYIAAAKKAGIAQDPSKFWAYEISQAKPEVGDLVCRDRVPKVGASCAGTTFASVDKGGISHCDIVVELGSDYIVILGGNTAQSYPLRGKKADTVGQRKIKLDPQGYVIPDQTKCKYFAIVKPPGAGNAAPSAPAANPAKSQAAKDTSIRSPLVQTTQASSPAKLSTGLTPPSDLSAYRKFRLTTYHVVDQNELPTGTVRVPIYDDQHRKIAEGSPGFFAQLSLEGTGLLTDKRLINVSGKRVTVSHDEYAYVLAYHRQAYAKRDKRRREEGRPPTPTTYSGIVVENDRVMQALAFHEVAQSKQGIGYGMARGIPYTPFRTLAADIGHEKYGAVDPTWKGKGGLVPVGTHVYIKEYDGLLLPDGTTHDGWFIVNDTGGAIFGAHFDVFVGTRELRKRVKLPEVGHIWFSGIEQRIPQGYSYGLKS